MKIDDKKIKEILLSEDYVTQEDVDRADAYVKRAEDASVVDYFVMEGILTDTLLGQAIAEHYKIAFADLASNAPSREQVQKIPEAEGKAHRLVLYSESGKDIVVATDNPNDDALKAASEIFKGKKIALAYALPDQIDEAFVYYRKPLETRFQTIIENSKEVAPDIIDEILEDAVTYRTSDIHIEPQEKEALIRFRIDGVLHEAGSVPKEYHETILNRIKIQSQLRIDEHFAPQDGAIRHITKAKNRVDMRVSITPTLNGEKIVIRILSQYVKNFSLSSLGLSPRDQEIFETASKKPFGMVLVTGPTGSGKTTSLYALLKVVQNPELNITTIEDPVEYRMPGVNQIQTNDKAGLSFARGLRSIVRQDPDVILVGEIRDQETAEISVNAALTGHMVFSTFHANDAATAVPRMLDMGVEPFLLASTLEVVVAQRLIRKLCPNCRYSEPVDLKKIEKILPHPELFFKVKGRSLYKAKGCDACGGSGYKGRIAIYEFIQVTREMEDLYMSNPSSQQIWDLARKQGSRTLFEDGLEKVKSGLSSLEELLRLASPPTEAILASSKK